MDSFPLAEIIRKNDVFKAWFVFAQLFSLINYDGTVFWVIELQFMYICERRVFQDYVATKMYSKDLFVNAMETRQ